MVSLRLLTMVLMLLAEEDRTLQLMTALEQPALRSGVTPLAACEH